MIILRDTECWVFIIALVIIVNCVKITKTEGDEHVCEESVDHLLKTFWRRSNLLRCRNTPGNVIRAHDRIECFVWSLCGRTSGFSRKSPESCSWRAAQAELLECDAEDASRRGPTCLMSPLLLFPWRPASEPLMLSASSPHAVCQRRPWVGDVHCVIYWKSDNRSVVTATWAPVTDGKAASREQRCNVFSHGSPSYPDRRVMWSPCWWTSWTGVKWPSSLLCAPGLRGVYAVGGSEQLWQTGVPEVISDSDHHKE